MRSLLDLFIRRLIRTGRLTIEWPNGERTSYGNGQGTSAALRLTDHATVRRIALHSELALGEAYMEGTLIPTGCTIHEIMAVVTENLIHMPQTPLRRARTTFLRILKNLPFAQTALRARRNAAHHYDLSGKLYSLFLDADRQYSCAYFPTGAETLEEAQEAKKRHIAAKLLLDRPGLTVLDIGCGWGGMALTLARDYGARVLGITLSEEQLAAARQRAAAAGLADQVRFELLDYRAVAGRFDRIVSVGMFEHVGVAHYRAYFDTIRTCLAPQGVALVHTIGHSWGPAVTNPWLAKYIFPGGYSPALSEMIPPIERSGLIVTDVEVLRMHYAQTLAHWRARFAANRAEIAALYDERFCRMFDFYLSGAEFAFRNVGEVVYQVQIAADPAGLPVTRNYMLNEQKPAKQNAVSGCDMEQTARD